MPLRVHDYNTWAFPTDQEEGVSDAEFVRLVTDAVNTHANRDSAMIGQRHYRANYEVSGFAIVGDAELRRLNPSIKVYHVTTLCSKAMNDEDVKYHWRTPSLMGFVMSKAELDANDWWLRDGWGYPVYERDTSGNVIMDEVDGAPIQAIWFTDVGKSGFKERYLELMLLRLAEQDYDGVVLDYWHPNVVSRWITDYGLPAPASYTNDAAWYVAWKVFFEYVCAGIRAAGYEVIGNCAGTALQTEQWAIDQRAACDGVVYENFVYEFAKSGSTMLSASRVAQRVAEIAVDPLVTWVCEAGLTELSAAADLETSLAFYYVGMTDRTLYHHPKSDMRPYRDPLWDIDLGLPLGRGVRQSVAGVQKYAWMRNFWGGCVVANRESSPFTFTLDDRSYVDLDGASVSGTITVAASTAKILRVASHVSPTKILGPLT